jgi:hypothetical protein
MEMVGYDTELMSKIQAVRRNLFTWVSSFLVCNWHIWKYLSECMIETNCVKYMYHIVICAVTGS